MQKKKWYQSDLLFALLLLLAGPTKFITLIPAIVLFFMIYLPAVNVFSCFIWNMR